MIFFSQESAGEDIPIMLLGNKTDKETERQVQKEVGEKLAKVCSVCRLSFGVFADESLTVSLKSNHSIKVVLFIKRKEM